MNKTAAIVIIGNEILSGKVSDENGTFLSRELRVLGVDVRRVFILPDEETVIGNEVKSCSENFDWVITTGGVGPTHDDVTLRGVAQGFGLEVFHHPELIGILEERYGASLNEPLLKLAEVPVGAELLKAEGLKFPIIFIKNCLIFPGIPHVCQRKFQAIKEMFREEPFLIRKVYLQVREEEIAQHLHAVVAEYPAIQLGSYPATESGGHEVTLTLESKNKKYLESAFRMLLSLLPENKIVKFE